MYSGYSGLGSYNSSYGSYGSSYGSTYGEAYGSYGTATGYGTNYGMNRMAGTPNAQNNGTEGCMQEPPNGRNLLSTQAA